jgi:hypothetical protein
MEASGYDRRRISSFDNKVPFYDVKRSICAKRDIASWIVDPVSRCSRDYLAESMRSSCKAFVARIIGTLSLAVVAERDGRRPRWIRWKRRRAARWCGWNDRRAARPS